MASDLLTYCNFCDLSTPHGYTVHYHGVPCVQAVVSDHPLDPRDFSGHAGLVVPNSVNQPISFELQVEDGTRFPTLIETDITKPCTLVVVKDGDVYGRHQVSLLPGDKVTVSVDEDNVGYSFVGAPMPANPEGKVVTVYYTKDSTTGAVRYAIFTKPRGHFAGASFVQEE